MKSLMNRKSKLLNRVVSIILAVAMVVIMLPAAGLDAHAATFRGINSPEVFLKQSQSGTCTLVANVMMLRRDAIIKGVQNWEEITVTACKPTLWMGSGMNWNYTYGVSQVKYDNTTLKSMTGEQKEQYMIEMIKSHPEGIVIYDWHSSEKYGGQHAVLLTDYTEGIFYVSDPARGVPNGRTTEKKCLISVKNIDSFWYVSNPGQLEITGTDEDYIAPTDEDLKDKEDNTGDDQPTDNVSVINPSSKYPVPVDVLYKGSKNDYVKWVQEGLNIIMDAGLTVDGSFGPATLKAVQAFQTNLNLEVTGVVDKATRETMISEWSNASSGNYIFDGVLKGICQMPNPDGTGGYLIGIETYDNPNNSYRYEMLILDCTLLAAGQDAWIYTTGKTTVDGNCLWTIWQPEYGYFWTLFRVYDENDELLDQKCYGFENIC